LACSRRLKPLRCATSRHAAAAGHADLPLGRGARARHPQASHEPRCPPHLPLPTPPAAAHPACRCPPRLPLPTPPAAAAHVRVHSALSAAFVVGCALSIVCLFSLAFDPRGVLSSRCRCCCCCRRRCRPFNRATSRRLLNCPRALTRARAQGHLAAQVQHRRARRWMEASQ
jgi:hypothetical protein